ncbi:MAG: YabP/YqfC family sporulation protein [Clostridia bacterium]|nr:YabP/YqfC family sporulation protein [Clostridia bacterium]MBR6784218.1 YabP/YqfC family sporulation protein [Clostridia bacterium]
MKYLKELFSKGETPRFIELRGRDELLLQGCSRICEYLPERICLSYGEGVVAVNGSGLTLRHLSEEAVAIDGRIDGVEFL